YQITLNTTNINITPVVKNLTFNIINNKIPSISLSIPSNNPPFSAVTGHDKMTISGNVTDQDVGDVLNIYYRIDSGSK
ncbi:hypothetical protein V6C27_15015, partial [Peptococcaceae bacterium 1198_IL3148]